MLKIGQITANNCTLTKLTALCCSESQISETLCREPDLTINGLIKILNFLFFWYFVYSYLNVNRSGPNKGVGITQLATGNTLACLHVNLHERTTVKELLLSLLPLIALNVAFTRIALSGLLNAV